MTAIHLPIAGAIDGVPTHYPTLTPLWVAFLDEVIRVGAYTPSGAELAAIAGTTPQPNPDFPQNPPGIYPAAMGVYADWTDPLGVRFIVQNLQMPLTGQG